MGLKVTGAKALRKSLEAEGVEIIFGIPGGVMLPVFDELYESKIRMVLTEKGLPVTDTVLRAEITAQQRMLENLGERSLKRISASLDELIGQLVTSTNHTDVETGVPDD